MSDIFLDRRFGDGITQFNRASFYEAHETLEDLWRETQGSRRDFLKGLIQISVGFLHALNGNSHGCLSLLQKGIQKLLPYPEDYAGMDLKQFRRDVADCHMILAKHFQHHPSLDGLDLAFPKLTRLNQCDR